MNKKILSFLLSILLLLGMLSGCGAPDLIQTGEIYEIHTAQDMLQIAKDPEGHYLLKSDLDMSEIDWKPIAKFSGIFDGAGKTISNLSIDETASKSGNMGLFGMVTAGAKVKNLHLENVTVDAKNTNAENIGTFAGVVEGDLEEVTATGVIYDDREDQEIAVGCLAGRTVGNGGVEGGYTVSATDDAGVHTTKELAADVKLFVAESESVHRGLVGVAADSDYVNGQWKDSFYSSSRQSETIRSRQQKVVDYMYKMGTQPWSVPKTMIHYGTNDESKKQTNIHTQIFKPGETYYGIPYDHTSGSYERFMYCFDENNRMLDWVTDLGTSTWGGELGFTKYIGNDCSAAVAWAWMQVSPNLVDKENSGAYVFLTTQMIPNYTNQSEYGIYPVGSWNGEKFDNKTAVYSVKTMETSPAIFHANGKERMMEAYARTRKADALVYGDPGGHVRLVAEDPVVIRNGDGSIDTKRSYFLCHEQGDGLYNNRYENSHSSWRINYRYTFDVMANGSEKWGAKKYLEAGSGDSYVPITIHALRKEEIPAAYAEAKLEITKPDFGVISSNYRIQSTTVTIKDAAGNVVYDKQAFVGIDLAYPDFRAPLTTVNLSDDHFNATAKLAPGEYTFTVKVLLANGEVHTIAENVSYTK